jgi:hypothetical protein
MTTIYLLVIEDGAGSRMTLMAFEAETDACAEHDRRMNQPDTREALRALGAGYRVLPCPYVSAKERA